MSTFFLVPGDVMAYVWQDAQPAWGVANPVTERDSAVARDEPRDASKSVVSGRQFQERDQ